MLFILFVATRQYDLTLYYCHNTCSLPYPGLNPVPRSFLLKYLVEAGYAFTMGYLYIFVFIVRTSIWNAPHHPTPRYGGD